MTVANVSDSKVNGIYEHEENAKNEEFVRKGFWSKIKEFAGKIPFTKDAILLYYCAIDIKTPLYAKGIALGALVYFISPIDVIPDTIPALGLTDDAAIIVAAVKAIADNVTDEHRENTMKFFNE